MSEDGLRYDLLVEAALRGVVRAALAEVARDGLPGDHHFYITFESFRPDVGLPERLRERYPREMTIVLQHQYWDLEVGQDSFTVTLSFNDIPEKLVIPYAAVTAFADPSVRFGLQFNGDDELDEMLGEEDLDEQGLSEDGLNEDGQDKEGRHQFGLGEKANGANGDEQAEKVVTLDQFRKKS